MVPAQRAERTGDGVEGAAVEAEERLEDAVGKLQIEGRVAVGRDRQPLLPDQPEVVAVVVAEAPGREECRREDEEADRGADEDVRQRAVTQIPAP
jgi:hypothetical protein